jgi:hypothetical protein
MMTERRRRRSSGSARNHARLCNARGLPWPGSCATRPACFQLCSLSEERRSGGAAQAEAEVRCDAVMSPRIGQPAQHLSRLRRRGASREAQAGRRSARRCDCAKAGCAVSWCTTCGTHPRALCEVRRAAAKQPQPPKPKPLTSTARARERCEHVSSGLGSAARGCDAAGWLACGAIQPSPCRT